MFFFPDVFLPLPGLRILDLFNNFKLFQVNPANIIMPRLNSNFLLRENQSLQLNALYFGDNLLTEVPTSQLESVNETLTYLDMSNNVFIELGMSLFVTGGRDTFPRMDRLEVLVLNACKIQNIHNDAFLNLANLRELFLKENPLYSISSAVMLPSLHSLHFQCMGEMFDEGEKFQIPEKIFSIQDMTGLSTLSVGKCPLETLVSDMFLGLEKLLTLDLDECHIEGIGDRAFSNLLSVTNLSLASCTGITELPASAMLGPRNLEVVDLSGIQIFPDDLEHILAEVGGGGDSSSSSSGIPMAGTRVLNLTGSLINMEDPLNYLALSNMPALEVLDMSRNRMTSWTVPKFLSNPSLRSLIIRSNHDYLNITKAMIADFQNLTYLDLSMNQFICNEGVTMFIKMADYSNNSSSNNNSNNNTLTVEGFYMGYGYVCKGKDGEKMSFADYADSVVSEIEPIPTTTMTPVIITEPVNYVILIGPILAFMVLAAMTNRAYSNRWYFQYKLAKRQVQQKQRRARSGASSADCCSSPPSFAYDAFVSYNNADREFVQAVLLPELEEGEKPNMRLCVHERDFKVGKSIFENIVECLEASRACIIVLSREYAKSEWCRFEAQMALQLFQV